MQRHISVPLGNLFRGYRNVILDQNGLTAKNVTARLAQDNLDNLASKNDTSNFTKNTDFDNKTKKFKQKIYFK